MTACASSTKVVTQTRVEYRDPPEELLHCPLAKPEPPLPDAIAGAWGVYILRLEAWGTACRDRLEGETGSVAAWVHQHRVN